MTFRFIADHIGVWPVSWMCDALDVSPAGFHAWLARPESRAELRRQESAALIARIHSEVKGRHGSPRMAAELKAQGRDCSENTVAGLMKIHGIRAEFTRRFVRTTDSRHRLHVVENVPDRDFTPASPNVSWGADITDIPTAEGWL